MSQILEVLLFVMLALALIWFALAAGRLVNFYLLRYRIDRECRKIAELHRLRERELASVIQISERRHL